MKSLPKLFSLIAAVIVSATLFGQTKQIGKKSKSMTINENTEWSNTWVVANNKHDLPKVLVIGDSHVNAYYPVLSDLLKDKAYVSKFTTSKCLGDPVYVKQLTWFLMANKFDVISFNNGLHGIDFTLDQYAGDLHVVYKLFKKYQPGAKLIWVNTTARRIAKRTSEFDSLNQQVIDRNKAVSTFTQEKQIPVVDSYTLSVQHPEFYQPDGIHFKPEGVSEEAKEVKRLVLQVLEAPRASIQKESGRLITGVFVDVSHIRHDSKSWGDTWDHIWADDGNLYTFGCDGGGYGTQNNNLNFNILVGTEWDQLVGSPVNPMSEYGKNGSYLEDNSTKLMDRTWPVIPKGPNWKVTGADCIDGVFYAFVAQNWYGNQNAYGGDSLDPYLRQTVNNMSLIKSTDKGLTWTRSMAENAKKPMWSSKQFSTGYFFKYGQNGGNTSQDDQDKFVYAISNNGYWNCGSAFYLGRVSRSKISNLNAADWQYYRDGKWTSDLIAASPVPGLPNGQKKCTMGSPVWLASLKRYVTVTWFDPCTTTKWHYPDDVTFAFYQAEHPWGPWSYIGEKSAMEFIGTQGTNRIHRWYGPTLSPKFISDNPDGSVTVIMLFSGQTWENTPQSLYKNNSCPVTFYTQPLPSLRETINNTAATYSDGWRCESKRGVGDFQDDIHVTDKTGSYCDFEFTGEGIEILSEKFHNMGEVEIILDGQSQGRYTQYQHPMPLLYQVPFFRKMDLAKGRHTIRIVNHAPDGISCMVDGFKIFGHADYR